MGPKRSDLLAEQEGQLGLFDGKKGALFPCVEEGARPVSLTYEPPFSEIITELPRTWNF